MNINTILNIVAIYFIVLSILLLFYTYKKYKLEESYKPFRGRSAEVPTKKQAELLKEELKKNIAGFNEERIEWFAANLKKYIFVRQILVAYTFGLFKLFE